MLLINLIVVPLACKNANSKLFQVVSPADIDAKNVSSFVQIGKLKFGKKIYIFVQTLSTKYGQDFEFGHHYKAKSLVHIFLLMLVLGHEIESPK